MSDYIIQSLGRVECADCAHLEKYGNIHFCVVKDEVIVYFHKRIFCEFFQNSAFKMR